jgi:hypothetical protein
VVLRPQFERGDLTAHPDGSPAGDRVEMRPYAAGDPLKQVLWKVYARTGRLLVRTPERAVMPCERTMAYLVASPDDEPAAGVARALLEGGALGEDFLFGSDGTSEPTADRHEALEVVIRSAAAADRGGAGLGDFLNRGEEAGLTACVLLVPHTPGAWLDRVAAQLAGRRGPFRALVGVDGVRPRHRWSLRELLVREPAQEAAGLDEVRRVCEQLVSAGAEVSVLDRTTGLLLEPCDLTPTPTTPAGQPALATA